MTNQISSCLVYTSKDPEYGEPGWVLDLADGFYPVATGSDRTAMICFHDAFEHGTEWRGTLGNEAIALGRTYVNRVNYSVSIDALEADIVDLLENFDSVVDGNFGDVLDREFPWCSYVGTWDQLYSLIAETVADHDFQNFEVDPEELEALIGRIYGLMAYGADSSLAFWGSIQNARQGTARAINALSIMSNPSALVAAMGAPDVAEFFYDFQFMDGFPVVLKLDKTGIVTFEQCYGSHLLISEIRQEMENWQD